MTNFSQFLASYQKHFHNVRCIACGSQLKGKLNFFAEVFDDRFEKKYPVFSCKVCGIGYSYPFLKEKQLSSLYQKYEPQTHHESLQNQNSLLYKIFCWVDKQVFRICIESNQVWLKKLLTGFVAQRFFQTFPLYRNKTRIDGKKTQLKVLDFGCGGGYFLLLAKQFGCEVYGVEFNPQLVKHLNTLGIKATLNVKDFAKQKFDIIRLNQVLEHLDDPHRFIRQLRGLLKDDGEFIIGVPNFSTPARLFGEYFFMHMPFHRSHFTIKSITDILNAHGLTVRYWKTKSCGMLSWSLLRKFHKGSSLATVPLKILEIFLLSMPLDAFKKGDCLEIYAYPTTKK